MQMKNFHEYLRERMDENEIAEIEKSAKVEAESLRVLQKDIKNNNE